MELGQAENAPATLDDLASFLDTPDEESTEEIEAVDAEESTSDEGDTEPEANDEQDDEESEESEDEEPAPVEKLTIKVKGDDGQEETLEVTPEEVAASYLRQKDYTKKTQALAQREQEAVQFFTSKHDEIRQTYLQKAEVQRAAIVGMAGLKSDAEMAELANSDPAAWVQENQRQTAIRNYLGQLDQQIQSEKQEQALQQQQRQEQAKRQAFQTAWTELQKDGIDKPKLAKIYENVNKLYGFSAEELGNVYDHRLVRALRDAAAYRELQAQKGQVTKKVAQAPKMPSRQHTSPAQTKRQQELDSRFRNGRAKLSDLAAILG